MRLDTRGRIAFGIVGLALIGGLAGCATFGGNVRGNFSCQAPGGTCAPTSAIDDQALATIDQGGPAPASNGGEGARFIRASGNKVAGAVAGRGLRIVLPARLDRFGHWREPQIVYADVTMSDVTYGAPAPGGRLSLSELAAGAPGMADAGSAGAGGNRAQTLSSNDAMTSAVRKAYSQGLQGGGGAANPAPDAATRQADPAAAAVTPRDAAKPAPLPVKVSAPAFLGAVESEER